MLNKKQSSHKNLWKVTVIIPLLSMFLWSFNTKTEVKYIPNSAIEESIITEETPEKIILSSTEKEFPSKANKKEEKPIAKRSYPQKKASNLTKSNPAIKRNQKIAAANTFFSAKEPVTVISTSSAPKKETVEFLIHKTSAQEDLDRIKRIFKNEYEVDIKFSNIQRNSDNEITSISIAMNSKKSNANFSVENETPITPIVISYDSKNDKMGIGQSGGKNVWFTSKKGKKGVAVYETDSNEGSGENYFFRKDKDSKNKIVIRSSDDDDDANIFIQSGGSETIFDFDKDSDKEPLFIIDGKEASKKEMKKLKSGKIKSIEVIKGDKAIKKYGKKAKDGVIDIITKKNFKKGTGFSIKKSKKDNVKIYNKENTLFVDKNEISPLILIDGKEVTQQELKNYDTDSFETINVFKGEKAKLKYGAKGKNGVVSIVTKK